MLRPLQEKFDPAQFPDLIIGLGQPDDAAVYRLSETRALVQTVDFFPPIVDDPYPYGAIAAANALSDIYAMGGEPLFALNVCAFPDDLDPEIIGDILRGGADKVAEAGAAIAGGHSVRDREPKYGLAVTGMLNPQKLLIKGGALPGDALVLTKPLGAGVITTAIKQEKAEGVHVDAAIASMVRLNRVASRAALGHGARAATDITGYGLIGHALEMAVQAGAHFRFQWEALPFLPGALRYGSQWIFAGGAETNAHAAEGQATFNDSLADWQRMMLFDPQTSGGLLVALSPGRASAYIAALQAAGEQAWHVGDVRSGAGVEVY